jgi:DNA topoisomerase III
VLLVIAEKPAVARDLARVLGVRPAGQHAFDGDRHVITWCVGHLVELDEPAAYDTRWKAWRLDTLPMVPAEFRLRPATHAAAQLRAVTRLLRDRRFTAVVNACDAGREGELIFRYVYQFAGSALPVRRLWISSLTDDAIRRGFAALRPGAQLDALADAARSRSEADWLVGMNATRAITARGRTAGHTALYSIGRVQTPTLAMLVHRELAIRAFVPRPYWEVRGTFTTAGGLSFTAGWRRGTLARLASAALAGAIAARDTAHGAAADPVGPRVERLRARTVREPPPLLFDLTSLQRTANRRFGLSAARTLEIAQALYERHKILTYPRTDSRHLSSDVARELPALFATLAAVPDYAPFAGELVARPPRPGRRIVDDARVHDHHAIIPTGKPVHLPALDRDERRLFDLVARRFLAAFFPDAEFAITEAWIRVGAPRPGDAAPDFEDSTAEARPTGNAERAPTRAGSRAPADPPRTPGSDGEPAILADLPPEPDRYFARGRVRIAAGWQAVAGIDAAAATRDRQDPDAEPVPTLPALVEGQPLDGRFTTLAKQTTPPARYTEATLLGSMESAGKTIDDEALRTAMKDCGLGTPATRAAIIETLLKRDYIARTRQQLAPTPLGIALIEALPVASLASPELTGTWEARLARIARGEDSRAAFMADISRYVAETVDAVRGASPPTVPGAPGGPAGHGAPGGPASPGDPGAPAAPGTVVGSCPRCSASVVARPREFACVSGCGFTMRNRVAGRAISAALAGVLLDHRRTQLLRGFRSKAGKPFAAILVLDDAGELRFEFANASHRDSTEHGEPRTARERRSRQPLRRRTRLGSRRAAAGSDRTAAAIRSPRPAWPTTADDLPVAPRVARRKPVREQPPTTAADLPCPRCRQGTLIAGSRGWGCSRWRDGCGLVIWFETAGRRLSPAQLRDLVTRGKTRKARFVSDRGTAIDGRLVLDLTAEGGSARLELADGDDRDKPSR